MSSRDPVGPEAKRVIEEGLELDLGIAKYIGVGRAAGLIFGQEIVEHALAVFRGEVDCIDVDTDPVGHRNRVDQVFTRGAVFVSVVVLPVLHEQAEDFESLLLQQPGGDGRIHASGHAYYDFLAAHQSKSTRMSSG